MSIGTYIDRPTREKEYRQVVIDYYDHATAVYRLGWGESFHLTSFSADGKESVAEATAALERGLADRGHFAPGMTILDVGCGIGGPACVIAEHSGANVVGLNLSRTQIAIARERTEQLGLAARVSYAEGDALNMPFEDAIFDSVYLFESMCYMPDKLTACREIHRVIKPGAVFLGYDWGCPDGISAADYERYIEPLCSSCGVAAILTPSQLNQTLTAAGFTVDAIEDAAERGNMDRMWEVFHERGELLAGSSNHQGPIEDAIIDMIRLLVDAARAGVFYMAHWRATKPV
ncbi:SAM-dependent methyltransferase [Nocardia brasiliensis]